MPVYGSGARSAQALSPESAPGPEFDLDRLDPIRRSPFAYAPGTVFTCIYLYTYILMFSEVRKP